MLDWLLFSLAVYGLANAITHLKFGRYFFGEERCQKISCTKDRHPFETRRFLGRIPFLGDIFYCPPCFAFWVGMAISLWMISPASSVVAVWWQAMILDGLGASATVWILHCVTKKLSWMTDI